MNKGLMPCRNRLRVTMLCFVLTCCSIVSGKNMVKGYVFLDANRNGFMDKGEAGIAHIPVSNGEVVTETDANGRFRLPLKQGQSVFPILPADYTIDSRVPNSRFFYAVTVPKQDVNFALISKPVKTAFRLNAIGDVQVGNYQELDYATRTLWPELLLTDSAEVNLFLGDLVNNNISFYPDMLALMDRLPSQSWTLLGNHDRDKDSIAENQNRTYNKTFGADVYAFNEGQVHFIVLNNVHADGKRGYVLEAKVQETAPEGRLHGITVCLDPGHSDLYGPSAEYVSPDSDEMAITNPGLCGQGHFTFRRESIVVLEIAYLLRDVLRAQGAEVVMTREDEYTWITSIPRADLAYDAGADFLLRLHADDRDEEDLRGVQVFCPLSSPYAQAVATPQEYRAMGEALMFAVRDACGYTERTPGCRVVLNDNYVGNNWARVPCFMLEMGYMSNRQDDYLLSHPDYQQLLAESIAEGVYQMALIRGLAEW